MTSRRWVRRSLRNLSADLKSRGHHACPNTVRRLLRRQGFSLRSNVKRLAGPPHPDREIQFQQIAAQRRDFEQRDLPVLSIDAKKKELIGNFKNPGRVWREEAESVNTYDFIHDAQCRATPYGIYDTRANRGHVCVGTSADTPAFAVEALADWWRDHGKQRYPQAKELLLLFRWRRKQRMPSPPLETFAATMVRPQWLERHGLPLSHRCQQVESGGTSSLQRHQHQLGRHAAANAEHDAGLPARHQNPEWFEGDGKGERANLSD